MVADSDSIKRIGRFEFLLYVVMVAAMCAAASPLMRFDDRMHRESPVYFVAFFSSLLLGLAWFDYLQGRILDAGLPRWYRWPYGLILPFACVFLCGHKGLDGPKALAFFVLIQIPTVLIRSNPSVIEPSDESISQEGVKRRSRLTRPVGRFVFMLIVLLFAIMWAVLTQLTDDPWRWLAQAGYLLIFSVWVVCLQSRFRDAGLPSQFSRPYAIVLLLTLGLPWEFKAIDNTMALMLFVLLQVPTVYFRSKPPTLAPFSQDRGPEETAEDSGLS